MDSNAAYRMQDYKNAIYAIFSGHWEYDCMISQANKNSIINLQEEMQKLRNSRDISTLVYH